MNLVARTPCEAAEEACLCRLRDILHQVDPRDASLCRLLEDVERHDRDRLEGLRGMERAVAAEEVDVEAYFPSLRVSLGEGRLTRDSAMYYVENLKEEAWRFFRDLARLATDEEARAAFAHVTMDELGEVARLRTVIL